MNRFKLLVVLFFSSFSVMAQNTMYFMDRMPQSISYNPAIMPKMKFFIGLPGLGGVSAQAYNSGFNYNELNYFMDHVWDLNYNPDDFVHSIGSHNNFSSEASVNLFSIGFKLKHEDFLSFAIQSNSYLFNTASSDIVYLLTDLNDLNDDDFPIFVDDINILTNHYLNFGVTYSRKINENLTLGITPKINFNVAGLKTHNISYQIDMTRDEYGNKEYEHTINGNVDLGLFTEINPDAITGNEFDIEKDLLPDNWEEDLTLRNIMKNKSLTLDLGATYEIEKWTFSASILNIGRSSWKRNGYKLSGNGGSTILISDNEKIKVGIPAKIYIGALRQFSPKWNYAILLSNNFYNTGSEAAATISLNGFVGSALSTSVSYTAGYRYDNFGIGLRMRFLPGTDLYFVTDNIIQAFNVKNAYRLTMAFGINIAVGVKEKKQIELPQEEELN